MIAGTIQERTEENGVGGKWSSLGCGLRGGSCKRVRRKVSRTESCTEGLCREGHPLPVALLLFVASPPGKINSTASGAAQSLVLCPQWPSASLGNRGWDATVL